MRAILWIAMWLAVILLPFLLCERLLRRERSARDRALMDQYNRASAQEAQELREAFAWRAARLEPMPEKYRKDAKS